MYKVKIKNQVYIYNEKKTLEEIAEELKIIAYVAKVNNRLRELGYYINYDCELEFLDLTNYEAARVYETSLRYLLIMAIEALYPKAILKFHQSISRTFSVTISNISDEINSILLNKISQKLIEISEANYPIIRKKIAKNDAFALYKEKGYFDKIDILKYRQEDTVNIYECNGYLNYMFGYMVSSTSLIKDFALHLSKNGFICQYPRAELAGKIPALANEPRYQKMIDEAKEWAMICDADTIAKMNNHIENSTIIDFVNMCETKHNNQLAELGLMIKNNINNIRLIAIAGPSSSGKTTFSHRLRIELMTRGLHPVKISIDDYYLNRNQAPKDEYGNPDLEHIEALDVDLFNKDLLALIEGKEVQLPVFDFKKGERLKGKKIKITSNQPIIIEGIHALNEKLTALIPREQKFKIYISPTTQINIDYHNPIMATDVRLLRRIVRDAKYRKTNPADTFAMWASVRKGEFKWIYPFQEEANYIFNTELTYELGVMKKYALPVLASIDRNNEYFIQANRLVKFLKYFKDIDDRLVPCNSLLREFIGESCFYE